MKKLTKSLVLLPILLGASSSLTSCSKADKITLRIINSEDYIYLHDEKDPESAPDMTDQFKDYIKKNYPQYGDIEVVYDTSDTNETLYSELQTGKSNYDLMNVSEYMAQKIVSGGYSVPFYRHAGASDSEPANYKMIPNYDAYASVELKDRIAAIEAKQKVYSEEEKKYVDRSVSLKDYAVGYMWGTLGILFNPEYPGFAGIGAEQVIEDMMSFDALWDEKYHGMISIKNSMRDTYALGLMHAYEDEFQVLKDKYDEDGDLKAYQEAFANIFNRCDENSVNDVKTALDALKKNIFGLEVDSGKEDIITKKIGVNLAWSGDAVYSMDQGEDEAKVGKDTVELCYSIPELGSNIWSDVWVMPNCNRSQEQYELAHLFLDFISDPINVAQNMEYTGYTSFVGGDAIIDLVRDWYDYRTDELYYTAEVEDEDGNIEEIQCSIYSVGQEEFAALEYGDFLSSRASSRNSEKLYYFIPTEELEEPETIEDILEQDNKVYLLDENDEETEKQMTYGDLLVCDDPESELEEVDLTYFFKGTLTKYVDGVDTIFYSDCYLPFTYTDSEGNEVQNISVGRQFFCQYPNEETVNRCAVMKDYGENNKYVMKMWENFKSDPLPVWAIIVFAVILAGLLALVAYIVVNKLIVNHIRKKRIANS